MNKKHQNKDWLHEQYVEKNLIQSEIAEKTSVGQSTISDWIRKFELKKKWNQKQILTEMYVDFKMSSLDIAKEFDCAKKTVLNHLHKFDIPLRKSNAEKVPAYTVDYQGYPRWQHTINGEANVFPEHRLLAIAKYGCDEVVGSVVHHKNGCSWDNRMSNIQLFDSQSEHRNHHINNKLVEA